MLKLFKKWIIEGRRIWQNLLIFPLFVFSLLTAHVATALTEAEPITLTIASAPNLWFAQPSIIVARGWDKEVGLRLEIRRFSGPAQSLQAFIAGEVDGMNNNLAAVLIAIDKGMKLQIVSGTIEGDAHLIARGDLSRLASEVGALQSLKIFKSRFERRVKIVTNPRGSLSDLSLRLWLSKTIPDRGELIELIHAADQSQLQQIFLSGGADAMSSFTPLTELAQSRSQDVKVIITPEEFGRTQAGGVFAIRSSFVAAHPEIVSKLQTLYLRATEFMKYDPETAIKPIDSLLIKGLIPKDILLQALKNASPKLTTDWKRAIPHLNEIQDLMVKEKYLSRKISISEELTPNE